MKMFFYSFALLAFTACSNETPMEKELSELSTKTKTEFQFEDVRIEDGIMKFKDADALCSAIINSDFVNSARFNLKNGEFKSLTNKYAELEYSHELMTMENEENEEFFSTDDVIKNRVNSRTLTDLLNDKSIMIVADNVIKVVGDYAYYTSIDNYDQLLTCSDEELKELTNLSVHRIITPLIPDSDNSQTKASTGGTYDRSPVFILTNDSKRREHVKFNPHLIRIAGAQAQIVIEMEGRAQKKKVLGIWGSTFSDEMVWGEIHLNSGSWNYNQPPVGGYPTQQGTNYFTTGFKAGTRNSCFCKWIEILGNAGGVSNVKANITYKAKKNDFQPTDWTGVYTNNYTSITE